MATQLKSFQAHLQVINQSLEVQSLGRGLVIPVLLLLHPSILENVVVVGPGRLCNVDLHTLFQPVSRTAVTPSSRKLTVTEQATLPTQHRYMWVHPGLQNTAADQKSCGQDGETITATGSTGKWAGRCKLGCIQGKGSLTLTPPVPLEQCLP